MNQPRGGLRLRAHASTRRATGSSGPSPRSREAGRASPSRPAQRRRLPSRRLAPPGSEVVVGDDVYGGTYRYLERVRAADGVDARYADLAGDPDALWEAMTEQTRLVWFETPTNPLLKVVDIAAAARAIRERFGDAPDRPLLVVDNTFASPALQRPLDLGADIVFHSATKYLAGHSDTVLGIAVTRDPAIAERLRFLQNAMGGVPGPFDCFLVLRGLRTLHLRVARHVENAAAVAAFLAARADVEWLSHPGLADGPARPSAGRDRARARCATVAG